MRALLRNALPALLAATMAVACQTVQTTGGGTVGVDRGQMMMVSAQEVEQASAQQYQQVLAEARKQNALNRDAATVQRVRRIANRLIGQTGVFRKDAPAWQWEVNVLSSKELNAWCMAGGKIAIYTGLVDQLKLTDDEIAAVMGHEIAHALREHARERMGKTAATRVGANIVSSLLGFGAVGDTVLGMGAQLLTLKFSRDDESEADIVGMELAARSGYDPAAGVTLWEKMLAANRNAPPEFMSTHPAGETRIRDIEAKLPKVQSLYQRAEKPAQRFGPPPRA